MLGYDFIVYTDQKPLINLKGFKDVVNRRYRWIEYLESMSVRLRYLPGAENIVADFISRNINEGAKLDVIRFNVLDMTSVVFDRNDLIAAQYNDSDLLKVIKIMQGNSTDEFPKCYRRHKNKLLIKDDMLKYRHHDSVCTVVPLKLRREILDLAHSKWFSGHLGIFKTHRRILELFWWSGLYEDIVDFITNCEICIAVKPQHRNPGRMGIREFPRAPMELVSIDFLVELPVTARNNRHIMCINEHCTKFIQIYPVSDRTAKTAAKCVFDFFLKFGISFKLYSDRDPAFEAELFQILMGLFGVKKLRTTGYNLRANGLTEKCNEFIKNYLTSYVTFSKKEWDLWCRGAAFTYNSSVHSSTGFTPARLMFGREYLVHLDVIYGANEKAPTYSQVGDYIKMLQKLYEVARNNMSVRQLRSATYYDKKVADEELRVGELVYVFYPRNKSKKLACKWFGPYRILQAKHLAYEIDFVTRSEWLTRDKLKVAPKNSQVASPFIDEQDPRPSETSDITDTVSSESEDDEVLEGDNIVDHPPRYNRRYNLRPNPHIPQPFGDYYVHCCDVIKNIYFC